MIRSGCNVPRRAWLVCVASTQVRDAAQSPIDFLPENGRRIRNDENPWSSYFPTSANAGGARRRERRLRRMACPLQYRSMMPTIPSNRASAADSAAPTTAIRGFVVVGFVAIAAFFLWTEHRAHVVAWLPYLLFLACPLMHFLHGGHHHGHRDAPRTSSDGKNV